MLKTYEEYRINEIYGDEFFNAMRKLFKLLKKYRPAVKPSSIKTSLTSDGNITKLHCQNNLIVLDMEMDDTNKFTGRISYPDGETIMKSSDQIDINEYHRNRMDTFDDNPNDLRSYLDELCVDWYLAMEEEVSYVLEHDGPFDY